MKFFAELYEKLHNNYLNYIEALDWLFSDDKFEYEWNCTKAKRFTKQLKRELPLLSNKNGYQYKNVKKFADEKSNKQPVIQHLSRDGEGKDFIRHIRNGIAHGRVCIKEQKAEKYIVLTDYSVKNGQNKMTAYMYMPIEYLLIMHKIYKDIDAQNYDFIESKF